MPTDLHIDVEDGAAQVAAISVACSKVGVNIEGFCATSRGRETSVHVLVENSVTARQAIEDAGFTIAAEREAIVIPGVEDRPGYLGELVQRLADADVDIGAAYLATNTRLAFAVDDIDSAWQAL